MAMKRRCPAAMAPLAAQRSAQIVAPKDAFSKLQPWKVRPSSVRMHAPTLKWE